MNMDFATPDIDTPILRVSRPIAACSRCRNSKIKCDGKLPACSACERAGKTDSCSAGSDEFARGKDRSYVAALEGQIERLEQRIAAARERQRGVSSSAREENPEEEEGARASTRPRMGYKARRKEASDIDDLVGDFGFLSVNATSRDFYGISSTTSFAGLLLAFTSARPLQQLPPAIPLSPRAQALPLIEHYFDNIYNTTAFLQETKFFASLDAVCQQDGRFASSFDQWTVRMVLAIAYASMSRMYGSQQHTLAQANVAGALQYAEDVLHPGSLAGIQCILLLAQYSMFDIEYFKTWFVIGQGARVTVDLGIHQEQISDLSLGKGVLDLRRRTFLGLYSIDRYVSTALGRAFSFSDDSVNVPLPESASLQIFPFVASQGSIFTRDINPALCLLEIRPILSDAYQQMFFSSRNPDLLPDIPTWKLCTLAKAWHDKMSTKLEDHIVSQFRLEFLFTIIILLSPSNAVPQPAPFNRLLLFEYSMDFIETLRTLIVASMMRKMIIITYIDIERAYNVSTKFLHILCSSYEDVITATVPNPLPVPPGTPLPAHLSARGRCDVTNRALECINSTLWIFGHALERWNARAQLDRFSLDSAHVKALLEGEQDRFAQQM